MRKLLTLLPLALLIACSSAVPTETPGVERLGSAVLRYSGPEVAVVIGYRFATMSIGDDWLMLDTAITGTRGRSVEVSRDKVSLQLPSGDTVPLASQEEFAKDYGRLQNTIARANIASEPLDYWVGRAPCLLNFFAAPGQGIAMLSNWVDDRRVCTGRLYFFIPQGIQPGHYTLGIDLEESTVRIPFELRESR